MTKTKQTIRANVCLASPGPSCRLTYACFWLYMFGPSSASPSVLPGISFFYQDSQGYTEKPCLEKSKTKQKLKSVMCLEYINIEHINVGLLFYNGLLRNNKVCFIYKNVKKIYVKNGHSRRGIWQEN